MSAGCRLTVVALSLLVVGVPASSAAERNITDIVRMLGPRAAVDVVGLLDRSQGVGRHNFYYWVQPFFGSLLRQYAAVHPDFARSAVVTFAADVTVAYDTVSGVRNSSDSFAAAAGGVSKCELFEGSPALYDRVEFVADPGVLRGTNVSGAMSQAIDILERGRANRPGVLQVTCGNIAGYR